MSDSYLDDIASIRQKLLKQWAQVQAHWTDKRARRFEHMQWQPLETASKDLLQATRDLTKTLKDARAACRN